MSHMLRAVVAATSLFTCPACVTTGSTDRTLAEPVAAKPAPTEPAPTESAPAATPAETPQVRAAPESTGSATGAAPGTSPAEPVGGAARWARGAFGPIPPDATATLLAWEQSQAPT